MAGDLESLLSGLDAIFEDLKSGATEIQVLKFNRDAEIKKREALQLAMESLKQENERLTKLYTESLNNLVDQVEHRTTCQSLKEQLKKRTKEDESVKQEYANRIADLEARIGALLIEKATAEATVNHLRHDLEAHKSHIQHLGARLNQVHLNVESRYELEILELKSCIAAEQEEKNELNKRVQHLEKELLICRSKPVKMAGTLERKENKNLKRKLPDSEEDY